MRLRKLLLTVVCLLNYSKTAKTAWDADFVSDFIFSIATLMQAQEFIWFLSERLDTEATEPLESFILNINKHISITHTIVTNNTDMRIIKSTNRKNSFSMVFTTAADDPIMEVTNKVMKGRHFYFGLVIMVQTVQQLHEIEPYIATLYKKQFQNFLLTVHTTNNTNHFYGYSIFPKFKIEDRTDFFNYVMSDLAGLMSGALNAKGYTFYTPLREDLPGVFRYKNIRGRNVVQGTSYNILKLFAGYANASLVQYQMPKDALGGDVIDMRAALNLVREKKVDILAHAYALYASDDDVDKSYPIMVVKWCLMVPIWNSVSTFYYPIQPFDILTWYAIIATFIALLLCDLTSMLLDYTSRILKDKLITFFRASIVTNFCFLINIALPKPLNTPGWLRFLLYSTIFFYGFFLCANYTSLLGSILAVTLFRAQINTMEDLVQANVSVMIIDYELDFLLAGGNDLPVDFKQLLLPVDAATFQKHQVNLNTSYAYFVTEDKWHFLELQQKHLKLGLFKFTDICFGSYHLAFPMQSDSPIWRNIEYYLYRVHSSGMLQCYESSSFDYAVHAGLVKRFGGTNDYTSAGMRHLAMVFSLLVAMGILSFIVLLCECLHHWFVKQKVTRVSRMN